MPELQAGNGVTLREVGGNVYVDLDGAPKTFERVTAVLAAGATEESSVAAVAGHLLNVSLSAAAWLRVYESAADRTADSGRLISVDPSSEVLAEVYPDRGRQLAARPRA